MYEYKTSGTCATTITYDIIDNKLTNVKFTRGCNGSLAGISSLIEGMDIKDVADKLQGVKCGNKATSCPDQLAKALQQHLE